MAPPKEINTLMMKLSKAILVLALFAGCAGPAGEAGAPGATGDKGAAGEQGEKGETGPAGIPALVRLEEVSEGEDCEAGGLAILTGPDTDNDGTLDDDEVTGTEYLCDEPAAPASLASVTDEPWGDNCRYGGKRIDTGLDADRDGVLDEAEIEASTWVCNGAPLDRVYYGDLVLSNPAMHALLDGVVGVVGNLIVASHVDGGVELPHVEFVSGQLVFDSPGLTTVRLPLLKSVGGMALPPTVTAFEAPALRAVNREAVFGGTSLEHLSLPALERVGQLIVVESTALKTVELPKLSSGSTVVFAALPAVESIELPALALVGIELVITSNDLLESVSLPALSHANQLSVAHLPALTYLSLPALTTTGGATFSALGLTELTLPALAIAGGLGVESMSELTSLSLPVLAEAGELVLGNLSLLEEVSLPALTSAEWVEINDNVALTELSLPLLTGVEGYLGIYGNPLLPTCPQRALAALQDADAEIEIYGNLDDGECAE